MPGNNRSIGGAGLEQGGSNLGNDYSRDITREMTADDDRTPVVPNKEQPGGKHKFKINKKDNNKTQQQEDIPADDE